MKKISQKLIGRIKSLRTNGYSIPEISQATIVAKSTVFRYAKDVEILPIYHQTLKSKREGSNRRK